MKFAKYTVNSGMASSHLKIKKDGHTMMPLHIKRELNRKSFLEENKLNLEVKIAELEKELSSIVAGLFSENELAILKLEQQAKGLSEGFHATKEPIGRNAFGFMMHYCSEKNLKDRVDDLRNQAKALKDPS
jgi:dGTP triphosphohydrolase